jgi:hypothetical protein
VGSQDDGDALVAQGAHQVPHVAAQFDIHASRRLVEEQYVGLVAQGLGDHDPALHAPGQGHDLVVALVPQGQFAQRFLDMGGVRRLAEQTPAEGHGRQHRFEGVGGQFLGHQADLRTRGAIVGLDVVAVGDDRARGRGDDAADHRDQGRLAGAVGAQQGEDLALVDRQVDGFEGLQP